MVGEEGLFAGAVVTVTTSWGQKQENAFADPFLVAIDGVVPTATNRRRALGLIGLHHREVLMISGLAVTQGLNPPPAAKQISCEAAGGSHQGDFRGRRRRTGMPNHLPAPAEMESSIEKSELKAQGCSGRCCLARRRCRGGCCAWLWPHRPSRSRSSSS